MSETVESVRIYEFLYAGNAADPWPRGECSVDGYSWDAWVRTSPNSGWLCVHHFQDRFEFAVVARERAAAQELADALTYLVSATESVHVQVEDAHDPLSRCKCVLAGPHARAREALQKWEQGARA